jgi:hypothetical protein
MDTGATGLGRFLGTVVRALRHGGVVWGIAISLVLAVASFAIVVAVVVSWGSDRFKAGRTPAPRRERHPALRILAFVGKNIAGVLLVLLGIVMAIPGVPGQGLLTALIGLTLISFPGKLDLERRLVRLPVLRGGINRLRARFRRPPLELD